MEFYGLTEEKWEEYVYAHIPNRGSIVFGEWIFENGLTEEEIDYIDDKLLRLLGDDYLLDNKYFFCWDRERALKKVRKIELILSCEGSSSYFEFYLYDDPDSDKHAYETTELPLEDFLIRYEEWEEFMSKLDEIARASVIKEEQQST